MKSKLVLAAFCCALLVACNGNNPSAPNNPKNQELIEQLGDLLSWLGNITSSETQPDGSVIMKDDKGNTITKDKDGNIKIVSADGETLLADNSIKEDPTADKDKWFNSKWGDYLNNNSPEIDPNAGKRYFIERLQDCFKNVEKEQSIKNVTEVYKEEESEYEGIFHHTTISLKQTNLTMQYTYDMTYQYDKYVITPQTIGEGEQRYRLVIEERMQNRKEFVLYEDLYYYEEEIATYVQYDSRQIAACEVEDDDAIYIETARQTNNKKEQILAHKVTTTIYNYRRLSSTQIAVNNSKESYILKEITDSEIPEMEVYNLDGDKLLTLQLSAL